MNLFSKRPLSLILCIFLGGFSLFIVKSILLKGIILSLGIATALLVFIHPKLRAKRLLHILIITFLVAFLLSHLYFGLYFFPQWRYDDEITIEGKITEIEAASESYSQRLTVKTRSLDDKPYSIYISAYYYGDEDLQVGDVISFSGKLSEFSSSDVFDYKGYMASMGISAQTYTSSLKIISNDGAPIFYNIKNFRDSICDVAINLSDKDSGGLFSALLLGDRDNMNEGLEISFTRIGITHILALSGMHITMLTLALGFILSLFKLNRRLCSIITMVFIVAFMALVGFPSSVVRAGLMMIISTLIYLLSGAKDNITSLFVAFTVIVLIEPYSIYDVGLWLSVLATFGVLILGEHLKNKPHKESLFRRFLYGIKLSLGFSLFAIAMTGAICSLSFDAISALSAVSTLIFSFLTQIYVYLGLAMLCIGRIIPIGDVLKLLYSAISDTALLLSNIPCTYYSTSPAIIKILSIILTVMVICFAVLKLNRKGAFILTLTVIFIISNVIGICISINAKYDTMLAYTDLEGERIILADDGTATMIEIGTASNSAGFEGASYLYRRNLTELDNYLLLGYTRSTPSALYNLLREVKVNNVYLPMPTNKEEEDIIIESYRKCRELDITFNFYKEADEIILGSHIFMAVCLPRYGYTSEICAFTVRQDDEVFSYITKSALQSSLVAQTLLLRSQTLIIGSRGKDAADRLEIDLSSPWVERVIINSEGLIPIYYSSDVIINYSKDIVIN